MSKFKYKLTLEVEEFGTRSYSSSDEGESQHDTFSGLGFHIAKAIDLLNSGPTDYEVVLAMSSEECKSAMYAIAKLCALWDAENDFESCIHVTVDLEKMVTDDEDSKEEAIRVINDMGWKIGSLPEKKPAPTGG